MTHFPFFVSAGENFSPLATDFSGTTVYARRASEWTGMSDVKTFTFSSMLRLDGGDGAEMGILANGDAYFKISRGADNKFSVGCYNAGATQVLAATTTSTYTASSAWIHLYVAADLANSWAYIYVNGSNVTAASPTIVDTAIDLTRGSWTLGARHDGAATYWNGGMAESWFTPTYYAPATYLSKFYAGGKPKDLGADGSTPTGAQPIWYGSVRDGGAAANIATNLGTGGDLTFTGTPTLITPSPWA